jgi:hypothetical protein
MGKNRRLLDTLWHDGTHLADAIMFLTGSALEHRKCWGANLTASAGTAWLEGCLPRPKSANSARRDPAPVPVNIEIGAGRDHCDPAPIPVIIEIGAGRDHLVFEMEFSCSEGRLVIGNGVFEVWKSGESPYAEKFRSLRRVTPSFEGPTGFFANMIADAAACVREPDRQPVSSAADGLAVIEYLHSVQAWRKRSNSSHRGIKAQKF